MRLTEEVNSLQRQLYNRAMHSGKFRNTVLRIICRKHYYDAVFEAAKGLAERVRQITGLTSDGGHIISNCFLKNDPYLFFNSMQTDSEK